MTPQQNAASLRRLAELLYMAADANQNAIPWALLAWIERIRDEAADLADELLDELRLEMERERATSFDS